MCVSTREEEKEKLVGENKKKWGGQGKEWSSKWRGRYPWQQPATLRPSVDGWSVFFFVFFKYKRKKSLYPLLAGITAQP
jgi:hypothetical protein